jgi:hypothetical protein
LRIIPGEVTYRRNRSCYREAAIVAKAHDELIA